MLVDAAPWWGLVLAAIALAVLLRLIPTLAPDTATGDADAPRGQLVWDAWSCLLLALLAAVGLPLLLGLDGFRIWRVPIEIMLFALIPLRLVRSVNIAWAPPGTSMLRWLLPLAVAAVWCTVAAGSAILAPQSAPPSGLGLGALGIVTVLLEAGLLAVFAQNFLQETLSRIGPSWAAGLAAVTLWTIVTLAGTVPSGDPAELAGRAAALAATGAAGAYCWQRHRSLWTVAAVYALFGASQLAT